MSFSVVAKITRTRNSAVWVDVYEWLLLDFLELEGLDFIGYLQFFENDDDLVLVCQQPAMHRNQRVFDVTFQGFGPGAGGLLWSQLPYES